MFLLTFKNKIIYIGEKEKLPENILPEDVKKTFRGKVELGAVKPITAEKLEERKRPDIIEAKKAMEETLKQSGL